MGASHVLGVYRLGITENRAAHRAAKCYRADRIERFLTKMAVFTFFSHRVWLDSLLRFTAAIWNY